MFFAEPIFYYYGIQSIQRIIYPVNLTLESPNIFRPLIFTKHTCLTPRLPLATQTFPPSRALEKVQIHFIPFLFVVAFGQNVC